MMTVCIAPPRRLFSDLDITQKEPARRRYETRSERLRLIDEAMVDGVEGKLQTIGDSEFIEDVVQVILYGLFADEEFFAYLLVAVALRYQLDDFFFPVAKQRLLAPRTAVG